MKSMLRNCNDGKGVKYQALMFSCPGCAELNGGGDGIHVLPVNSTVKSPSWTFDGNTDEPTLSPSILTHTGRNGGVCHSYMRNGTFEFLGDCTHSLAGQTVPVPSLPDWILNQEDNVGIE